MHPTADQATQNGINARRASIAQLRREPWVSQGYLPAKVSMDASRTSVPPDLFKESVSARPLTQVGAAAMHSFAWTSDVYG